MTDVETIGLRQAVVVASDRDAVVRVWREQLGLGGPFHDPGVETFGLCNSVVPVGDQFLEVVSPLVPGGGSAGERHMARNGGDAGYMAIFQVGDITAARAHLAGAGARSVLDLDLDDISGTHVHPADVGGAILSFDQATPPGSWRWAGPAWERERRTDVVDGLAGITLAADDSDALIARWSEVLDVEADGSCLPLPDGTSVRFEPVGSSGRSGIVAIDLWAAPGVAPRSFECAGVEMRVVERTGTGR